MTGVKQFMGSFTWSIKSASLESIALVAFLTCLQHFRELCTIPPVSGILMKDVGLRLKVMRWHSVLEDLAYFQQLWSISIAIFVALQLVGIVFVQEMEV
mmetsp:Transcript_17021/g.27969  ORF Transcript_17021/g.27969 Transcript_17021/m.27969 type:complete len:99 (+) Transcript_17021:574-870(+)